jgi:hypothetical protein
MRKPLGLLALLLVATAAAPARADAFDSVTIEPAAPTSVDRIRITIEGFWTCPRLSAPEMAGRLVVLAFDAGSCLAPPTHWVFERIVAPLDPGPWALVILGDYEGSVLHQQQLQVADAGTPIPPDGPYLVSPEVPGFRFKVRLTDPDGTSRPGTFEAGCLAETLCASGALAGRPEVLLRVVGPKPNGYLWPTFVRFTTAMVEVWVEREDTAEVKYYRLAGTVPGGDELDAGFDRFGFSP